MTSIHREPVADDTPDVIIVDGDVDLVEMLLYGLRTHGLAAASFTDGHAALAALRALDTTRKRPLLLLEVNLPGLDGLTLQEELRRERGSGFTTLFLTSRDGETDQLRGYHAGALDYVIKPLNLRLIMAKLPQWMSFCVGGR